MTDSSSIKDELNRESWNELSVSSSSKTETPVAFTGYNDSNTEGEKESRRGSVSSVSRSLDIVRRSFTGQSISTVGSANYSTREIFGEMDSDEIDLQRCQTKKSILDELVNRTQELEESYNHSAYYEKRDDLESQYEELPEMAVPVENNGDEFQDIDPELITWDGHDDPEDPRNWNLGVKMYLVAFVSIYTLVSPMSSSMPSPAIDTISDEFGITSSVIASMIISIQILAWAVGPLLIAPLSENDNFGRKIVLDISIWMSFFFNIGCAFSKTTTQMMVCRFVGGLFGSSPINIGAGVISDLFDAKSRNFALAGFSLAPLLGPVIAPVIAGFISDHMQWRWIFYVLSIFNGVVAVLGTLFYKETYAPALLKRKAKQLRKQTGNQNLHTIYEITNGETFWGKMYVTMSRPLKLLITHPMIMGLGSFMAFTYGFMYLMIVTYPTIYGDSYGFSKSITGLMYIPMGIGFILGVMFWTVMIDKIYRNLTKKNGGVSKPEFKLPCLCTSGIGIAIGLFWYGWSVQYQLHWIMPSIGSAIFAFSFIAVFQTIQNYLIDMNSFTAASSVAAAAVFRSILGFIMPLVAQPMYKKLTYGWGNTMFGFIALLLGIPFPIFCYMYGEKLRTWANKRFELKQLKRDQKNLEKLRKQI